MSQYTTTAKLIQRTAETLDGERTDLLFDDDVSMGLDTRDHHRLIAALAQIEVAVASLKLLAYDVREKGRDTGRDDWLETTMELLEDDPDYMDSRIVSELFGD